MAEIKIERIKVEDMLPTSPVKRDRVIAFSLFPGELSPPIKYIVDPLDGQRYVAEGNHKWFAALARGDNQIEAIPSTFGDTVNQRLLSRFKG